MYILFRKIHNCLITTVTLSTLSSTPWILNYNILLTPQIPKLLHTLVYFGQIIHTKIAMFSVHTDQRTRRMMPTMSSSQVGMSTCPNMLFCRAYNVCVEPEWCVLSYTLCGLCALSCLWYLMSLLMSRLVGL